VIVTVGHNGAIPLPEECKFHIGDILICTVIKDTRSIKLERFEDQTLTDEEIKAHGSLTKVSALDPKDFE